MFRTTLTVASVIATMAVATSTVAGPIAPKGFTPNANIPVGTTLPTLSLLCTPDPAIVSVTLTKGARRGDVRISYLIVNNGPSAWRSGANQQGAHLRAQNANTGRTFVSDRPMTGVAAVGGTMARFTTPVIPNAFDDFEFAGHVDLFIGYDPDILIDGNRCNDDADTANNALHIDNGELLGFMRGTARSQTFYN